MRNIIEYQNHFDRDLLPVLIDREKLRKGVLNTIDAHLNIAQDLHLNTRIWGLTG